MSVSVRYVSDTGQAINEACPGFILQLNAILDLLYSIILFGKIYSYMYF